jgi:DNA-binding helix-hairpin-helix protein with protein kinase domain
MSIWDTREPRLVVTDEYGRDLALTRRLGAGGQGTVWEVAGGRLAVKLLRARGQAGAEALHQRIRQLRRLDLDGLPLARPLAVLQPPHLGYVMEMLADMIALQNLLAPPAREDLVAWYTRTGGLRRRLRLLGRVAAALGSLHARAMVYGDPSPANLMVSEPIEQEQVWLVDTDNVAVASRARDTALGTPGYRSPDVTAGRHGLSTLSDAYAFAVIAFETLAVVHPFIGDQVYQGEPALQERAFAGELPWIDQENDDRNRSSFGIPRGAVLTPGLLALAARVFEAGKWEPAARPTVGEWRTKLFEAADLMLVCERCRGSFYAHIPDCPWCGNGAPAALIARACVQPATGQHPDAPTVPVPEGLVVQDGLPVAVPGRIALMALDDPEQPIGWLQLGPGGRLTARTVSERPMWLVEPGGDQRIVLAVGVDTPVPGWDGRPGPAWDLHFGPPSEPHRLLRFTRLGGRRSG